jgi:hypothetical protein
MGQACISTGSYASFSHKRILSFGDMVDLVLVILRGNEWM